MPPELSRRSFALLLGGVGATSMVAGAGTYSAFSDEETASGSIQADDEFPQAVRINCGGPEYTAVDGTTFAADDHYTDGNTYSQSDPIANTNDDELYQTERYGDGFQYDIPVVNGTYNVHIHLAEIYWETEADTGSGWGSQEEGRRFTLEIEGSPLVEDYDLYADVGHDVATVQVRRGIAVTDTVTITGTATLDNAKINAIEVVPSSISPPTPPRNLSSPTHDSSSVDFDWNAPTDDGGSPLDRYTVYVDGTSNHDVAAGTTNASVTDLLPGTSYDFTVTAVNEAGVESDDSNTVTVTTDDGPGPVAHWPLDVQNGSTTPDVASSYDASLVNDASLEAGRDDSVLSLNGNDQYADAGASVLDTSGDYSVSAWVNFDDVSDFRTAVSQDGENLSEFYLQYRQDENALAFSCHPADDVNTAAATALGPTPNLNQWYHLVGVHDADNDELRLYVDGSLVDTVPYSSGFTTSGDTVLGRALWNGDPVDYFEGMIDDVRLFDRVLGPGEISDLSQS